MLKKNLVYILVFAILFLCVFSTNSFASYDVEYLGTTYTLPDLPSDFVDTHYIIVMTKWAGSEYYSLYYTNDSDYKFISTGNGFDIVDSEGNRCDNYIRDANMTTLTWGDSKVWGNLTNIKTFITASDTIYNTDGTVFFQGLPQILAKQVRTLNLGGVQVEIMQILPLILVVVVSLVGLRKAWFLLSQILRKA